MDNKELLESMEIAAAKKAKEGMQESGDDQYVNEKKMQKKINPNGLRNDKEPADVPLDIDELSYSKKGKKFVQVPPNQPAVYDANTAKGKTKKDKKYDINRVEQIHSAWKQNKAKEEKHDMNRVEKMKVTRADDEKTEKESKKSDSYFGNFDGHDGHSGTNRKSNKLNKDRSDYEGGNF